MLRDINVVHVLRDINVVRFVREKGPTLETLDFTIRVGSTPTLFYFDLYFMTGPLEIQPTNISGLTKDPIHQNVCYETWRRRQENL